MEIEIVEIHVVIILEIVITILTIGITIMKTDNLIIFYNDTWSLLVEQFSQFFLSVNQFDYFLFMSLAFLLT